MTLSTLATLAFLSLATAFSVYVISQKREPAATLSWILAFFFLPYMGMAFFLLVGYRQYRRKRSYKPPGFAGQPPPEILLEPKALANIDSEVAELEKMAAYIPPEIVAKLEGS